MVHGDKDGIDLWDDEDEFLRCIAHTGRAKDKNESAIHGGFDSVVCRGGTGQ